MLYEILMNIKTFFNIKKSVGATKNIKHKFTIDKQTMNEFNFFDASSQYVLLTSKDKICGCLRSSLVSLLNCQTNQISLTVFHFNILKKTSLQLKPLNVIMVIVIVTRFQRAHNSQLLVYKITG